MSQTNVYGEPIKTVTDRDKEAVPHIFRELEYGVDISNSVIYITGEIDETSVTGFMMRIRSILKSRDKKNKDPINVVISSPGGDVYSMLGMIDYMRSLSVKVNTICRGFAMSAAAVILTAGTGKRVASKHSTIMFHELSTGVFGKATDVINNTDHVNNLQKTVNGMLGEYTKKTAAFWAKNTVQDKYLTAGQALEYGVIDEIT